MDRFIVISSDCHAGLQPAQYREYLDPQYREMFDFALPIEISAREKVEKNFLIKEINEEWRKGNEMALQGKLFSPTELLNEMHLPLASA
jgi:hypothetical protein